MVDRRHMKGRTVHIEVYMHLRLSAGSFVVATYDTHALVPSLYCRITILTVEPK